MKHKRIAAALCCLFLLPAGCGTPAAGVPEGGAVPALSEPAQESPTVIPGTAEAPPDGQDETESGALPDSGSSVPSEAPSEAATEAPTQPQSTEAEAPTMETGTAAPTGPSSSDSRLVVCSTGYYSGPFPEDGSDEDVLSVAVLLVENRGDTQLQFAELHYLIDGREAVFRISELPAGERVMAAELNRLVATPVSEWSAQPTHDVTSFLAAAFDRRIDVNTDEDGRFTVTNNGADTCTVDLYYKQRYDETTLLGGIAYHVRAEALAPGETRTVDAGHWLAQSGALVRVTAE